MLSNYFSLQIGLLNNVVQHFHLILERQRVPDKRS